MRLLIVKTIKIKRLWKDNINVFIDISILKEVVDYCKRRVEKARTATLYNIDANRIGKKTRRDVPI